MFFTKKELIFILCFFINPVLGLIDTSSSCFMTTSFQCTYFCNATNFNANDEVLIISKQFEYYTLSELDRSQEYDIYHSKDGFLGLIQDSGRYSIAEISETASEITINGAIAGDAGWYNCRTEHNGEIVEEGRRSPMLIAGQEFSVNFARKTLEDQQIVEVYENNTSIVVTEDEFKEIVLLVNVNNLLYERPYSRLYADAGNAGAKPVSRVLTTPDLTNYVPRDALATGVHYTEKIEDFEILPFDEFTLEGSFDYVGFSQEAHLDVHLTSDGHINNPSIVSRLPILFLLCSFVW